MKKQKVAVLIPTRNREGSFKRAVQSVIETSEADVLGYLDDDAVQYGETYRVEYLRGPRIGCGPAWQKLAEMAFEKEYAAVASLTDDAIMTVKGWDDWMLRELRLQKTRIQAFRPVTNDEGAYRMDMPAISREWFDAVGWFIHPHMKHYGWPSVIDALSYSLCLTVARPDQMRIVHYQESGGDLAFEPDARTFYEWYVWQKDEGRRALAMAIDASLNQENLRVIHV